jgi:glucose/arabinose dehydrogenase
MSYRALRILPRFLFLLLLGACGGGGGSDSDSAGVSGPAAQPASAPVAAVLPALTLQTVASGLSSPLFLTAPSGDPRLFIAERPGRIRIVQNGVLLPTPFLDISNRTTTEGERGFLSIAFDPQYAANGFVYVFFTDTDGNIAVERFTVSAADPNVAAPLSALRILSIPHPGFSNHNGGLLSFGPDGLLYIGVGDGGGAGDTSGNAQNRNSLLGKLLRIDVSAASAAQPYAIPASNPFINLAGTRPEIWAFGLRNPWRYAFDASTGLLYIADVGQDQREEVNVASLSQGGLNYGWNILEGTLCFGGTTCNRQGLVLPVLEYAHDNTADGGCSVIGGYVYRGSALPELQGSYFYADLCAGWMKSFTFANGAATGQIDWGNQGIGSILSFGQDEQKELYLLSGNGGVFRIVRK